MFFLVYASKAAPGLELSGVEKILAQAVSFNSKHGITGVLLMEGNYFLQYLEGHKPEVESLFAKISQDPRHRNVMRLISRETGSADRLFPDWGMGFSVPDSHAYHHLDGTRTLINVAESPDSEVVLNFIRSFSRQGMLSVSPFG